MWSNRIYSWRINSYGIIINVNIIYNRGLTAQPHRIIGQHVYSPSLLIPLSVVDRPQPVKFMIVKTKPPNQLLITNCCDPTLIRPHPRVDITHLTDIYLFILFNCAPTRSSRASLHCLSEFGRSFSLACRNDIEDLLHLYPAENRSSWLCDRCHMEIQACRKLLAAGSLDGKTKTNRVCWVQL